MIRGMMLFAMMLTLLGCRQAENVVSGTVTIDGEPLARGTVTFYPVDSTQATRGAEIQDGEFIARNLPRGLFRAVVREHPNVEVVTAPDGTPLLRIPPSQRRRTARMQGNETIVDIGAGKQTCDIALTTEMSARR